MEINSKNIIGFEESEGTGKTLQGVNPATQTLIDDSFFIADESDVDNAMQKAADAFSEYKQTTNEHRAVFLESIADEMEALGNILIKRASEETGLSEDRIIGERGRTTGQLRMFADFIREGSYVDATIDTAQPERTPVPKPDLRKMNIPLGPVVVFGASNFPLAYSVAGGDTAAALAAGCPVVVKAHPGHPGTSALVGTAIVKAAKQHNMPDGVFSLLYDSGFLIGKALVEHPDTRAVGFTGSTAGGRALFDIASGRKNPIPVFAEMGSINPSVLLPGAMKNRSKSIAESYAGSIIQGVGQFCTNPGLMLAIKGDGIKEFINHLSISIAQSQPAAMLHSGISKSYRQKIEEMSEQLGVEFISQSESSVQDGQGWPVLAKAPAKEFLSNPKLHEEVFGPFSIIIECENKDELVSSIAALSGQLTTTIHGEENDLEEYYDAILELREKAGRVIFNGVPTGVEVCPSMTHGGPYPATTDSRFTAVGVNSIKRFMRPVSFQNAPQSILPGPLKDNNPLGIWRMINSDFSKDSIN